MKDEIEMMNKITESVRRLSLLFLVVLLVLTTPACHRRPDFSQSLLPQGLVAAQPEIDSTYLIDIDERRIELTLEYFRIHHPELFAGRSPSMTPEAISFLPRMVVVHFTDISTLKETLDYFEPPVIEEGRPTIKANGLLNVGIQFIVDSNGKIYRSYPETVMARHTIGLNHVAIGIENVGNADLSDWSSEAPLTMAQVWANVDLISYLAAKYPSIRFVIAHSEYRDVESEMHPASFLFHEQYPDYRTEKIDPGKRFMRELRKRLSQAALQNGESPDQ